MEEDACTAVAGPAWQAAAREECALSILITADEGLVHADVSVLRKVHERMATAWRAVSKAPSPTEAEGPGVAAETAADADGGTVPGADAGAAARFAHHVPWVVAWLQGEDAIPVVQEQIDCLRASQGMAETRHESLHGSSHGPLHSRAHLKHVQRLRQYRLQRALAALAALESLQGESV